MVGIEYVYYATVLSYITRYLIYFYKNDVSKILSIHMF
jgi:hypothetical protein